MSAATPAREAKAQPPGVAKDPLPSVGLASTHCMVLVKVGPKSVHYHVHKALLVHHSEYFRNALTGP
ncbi:hypothetical protein HBI56_119080 [Parastagonospora nodorum]|nr:hypothetical protein HBH56_055680 [Parastagonospora nodorum]KAH3935476.1 hypothetical protein HBH54_041490 [Parastagonospora nodorum]KAH3948762.1 hypothetical protein HBH53_097810 [Parastagonospora nodorum]KAH3970140.1 hypothetical protein HBH51_121620 [Parastagonospora nodorum]KAH3988893.1 hypothetical protein HBH52_030120 [Parastagonospora nodorum]